MKFWGKRFARNGGDRLSRDSYIKIVFFDIISVGDYLKVRFGGERAYEILDAGKTATDVGVGSELSGQAGGKTKATGGLLIGSGVNAKVRRLSSRQKNTLLKSTSLTDYLDLFKKDNNINVFKDYTLAPYNQSMTHLKMMAPYVSIIDGKIPIDEASGMYLDLKSFDKSLSDTRGYFEMIASKNGDRDIVLRFNSEAFYNNYSLYDITKMDLVFHAIKVGISKEIDLSLTDEIAKITGTYEEKSSIPDDGFMKNYAYSEIQNSGPDIQPNDLDVYDVVFAGVVAEK